MLIAKCSFPHIGKLDSALRASVHEPVTADWMKLGRCDYLREFFHVGRFDIHNVEALVLNVEIPQVDSEVITANESFAIAVHGDTIYMVCVGVGVRSPWNSSHNGVMVCQAGKFESRRIFESAERWSGHATTHGGRRGQFMGQIVLSDQFQGLVKHLPQLYGLVVCRKEEVRCILPPTPFYLVDLFFDL